MNDWCWKAGRQLIGNTIVNASLFETSIIRDSPGCSDSKASAYNVGDPDCPWIRKIPWRKKWQPTPVFSPGKSHGWRSLVGYSPQGREEYDMTERLHFTSIHC